MSEYHLRYGGYGGIGYYMVSDMYIALFSRFTTCGSWEGHNILDYLVEKRLGCAAEYNPRRHAGPERGHLRTSALLGIQLQPRIRKLERTSLLPLQTRTALRTHRPSLFDSSEEFMGEFWLR
jgi:TnpA family transposase